jgi:hypothetical protein
MRRTWLLFVVCSSLLVGRALDGQAHADGEILGAKPRPPLAAFESLDDFGRSYFSRDVYERGRAQQEFEILDIRYAS